MRLDEHNLEKHVLERTAVRQFVRLYNMRHDNKLRLLYQQEKPDAVLQDSKRGKLGMEITHLFYDEHEAKLLLGRADGIVQGPESLHHLIRQLNELIQRKERKLESYSPDYPISLLIRNTSLLFGLEHFQQHREHIYEQKRLFRDIWFLTRNGTPDWLLLNWNELQPDSTKGATS